MLNAEEILAWLLEEDPQRLEPLWRQADDTRRASVGDEVHLRGLIEFSNVCRRQCLYCGLRAPNRSVERYRMSLDEIMECVCLALRRGYGTVVLQSGEDPCNTAGWVTELIRRIRCETPLAVTLSLGEHSRDDLAQWREAGADRYLLRFETSNAELLDRVHPPLGGRASNRLELLAVLEELGYEVGSGNLVGLPGQTYRDLARDIELFHTLDLDMIGLGPYIPHPDTPLGKNPSAWGRSEGRTNGDTSGNIEERQVPNTELMTYKVMALTRILCPGTNIPTTTALATLNPVDGLALGLSRGANVFMPNITPSRYRDRYAIYPGKACLVAPDDQSHLHFEQRIRAMGRVLGRGRGDSPNYLQRRGDVATG